MAKKSRRITRQDFADFFKSDRAVLLACIGISLFFWLLVKLSLQFKTDRNFVLQFQFPEGQISLTTPPKKVTASLEGKGWDLLGNAFARSKKITFSLVGDRTEYTFQSSIINSKVQDKLPSSINVRNTEPDYIRLTLEPEIQKKVPIRLISDISPSPQYQLKQEIIISPDSVQLSGPESLILDHEFWETQTLKLENLKSSSEQPVILKSPLTEQISLQPRQVKAMVEVEQLTEKAMFLPIIVKNAPDSLTIFPEKVKISFVVGLSQYNEISSKDFSVEVDLKDISLNSENNTVPILLTQKHPLAQAIHFTPKSIEFYLQKEVVQVSRDSISQKKN